MEESAATVYPVVSQFEQELRQFLNITPAARQKEIVDLCLGEGYDSMEVLKGLPSEKVKELKFGDGHIERLKRKTGNAPQAVVRSIAGVESSEEAQVVVEGGVRVISNVPADSVKGVVTRGKGRADVKGPVEVKVLGKELQEQYARREELACTQKEGIYFEAKVIFSLADGLKSVVGYFDAKKQKTVATGFLVQTGTEVVIVTALHVVTPGYKSEDEWPNKGSRQEGQRVQLQNGWFQWNGGKIKTGAAIPYPGLDVAVVTVEEHNNNLNPIPLAKTGLGLRTGAEDISSRCIVVGHATDGKMLVSMQRENFMVSVSSDGCFVQYFTDTELGFSGGPVLVVQEGEVRVAAVHHSGQACLKEVGETALVCINEGTLLSCISALIQT